MQCLFEVDEIMISQVIRNKNRIKSVKNLACFEWTPSMAVYIALKWYGGGRDSDKGLEGGLSYP